MALINIEYGSLASSDTMNKNFAYLEDKIEEVSNSTTTVISSILSNIATINSRLGEFAEAIQDASNSSLEEIGEVRTRARILFNKMSCVPNWELCYSLRGEELNEYIAGKNGFVLIYPNSASSGEVKVNNKSILTKEANSVIDVPITLPVKEGDRIIFSLILDKAYFIPVVEIAANQI